MVNGGCVFGFGSGQGTARGYKGLAAGCGRSMGEPRAFFVRSGAFLSFRDKRFWCGKSKPVARGFKKERFGSFPLFWEGGAFCGRKFPKLYYNVLHCICLYAIIIHETR